MIFFLSREDPTVWPQPNPIPRLVASKHRYVGIRSPPPQCATHSRSKKAERVVPCQALPRCLACARDEIAEVLVPMNEPSPRMSRWCFVETTSQREITNLQRKKTAGPE